MPTGPGADEVALAGHRGDEATARAGLDAADPRVREVALGALRRLGGLDAAVLTRALEDPDPAVRRRAAEESGGLGLAGAGLVRALGDPDPSVVEAAAWGCGELDPAPDGAVSALSSLASDHDDPLCREAAVAALGAIGDPAGLPAILAATGDKPAVRRRAVIALAPYEGTEVESVLERALEDRDRQVRQAAEDLLGDPD